MSALDAYEIRKDFPVLAEREDGGRLIYLDSTATAQKPRQVIDKITDFYRSYNANIHRGIYRISERATEEYESSKEKVAKFINAKGMEEIVYTRNTTESINCVARTWGEENIGKGDHILITELEHHSNIVPWQMLAKRRGAVLDYVKANAGGNDLDMESFEKGLGKNPKLLAITGCSNVLGTMVDAKALGKKAHGSGAKVLVDAAQTVPHAPTDVKDMDCDFLAFSGHKMLGPTGIGVLYAKRDMLEAMPPLFGGGDMILTVTHDSFTTNDLPWKFEAGTSHIEGGIGLGAAVDYLERIGMENIRRHETDITKYAIERFEGIKGVRLFGLPKGEMGRRGGIVSFGIEGVHPHDIASVFDRRNIAIRAGHHCAMPLVTEVLGVPATARMSFYIYNGREDVDAAADAVEETKRIFKVK